MEQNESNRNSGATALFEEAREKQSLVDLIKELRDETIMLLRQEFALARREAADTLRSYTKASAYLAAAGVIGFAAVIILLMGAGYLLQLGLMAAGLSAIMSAWIAFLAVGVVVGAGAFGIYKRGVNLFKQASVVPEKTIHSLKEDREWIRDKRK